MEYEMKILMMHFFLSFFFPGVLPLLLQDTENLWKVESGFVASNWAGGFSKGEDLHKSYFSYCFMSSIIYLAIVLPKLGDVSVGPFVSFTLNSTDYNLNYLN